MSGVLCNRYRGEDYHKMTDLGMLLREIQDQSLLVLWTAVECMRSGNITLRPCRSERELSALLSPSISVQIWGIQQWWFTCMRMYGKKGVVFSLDEGPISEMDSGHWANRANVSHVDTRRYIKSGFTNTLEGNWNVEDQRQDESWSVYTDRSNRTVDRST